MDLRAASSKAFISIGYLSEVERGLKQPSAATVADLCQAYGITYPALMRATADVLDLNAEAGRMLHWYDYETETLEGLAARPAARI